MASRAASVILAVAAPALFGGCGTMLGNLGGISYNSLGRDGHRLEPYGGVKICLEAVVRRTAGKSFMPSRQGG